MFYQTAMRNTHTAIVHVIVLVGCGFLAGCPLRIGREFLVDGTFNQTYLRHCEQLGGSRAVDRRRRINAYTALLYMDSAVAAGAVREAAEVRPEYGIRPMRGVDTYAASVAMHKLIPLHVDEGNWDELLEMLTEQQSLLLMTSRDEKRLVNVVVALEGIGSHCQDKPGVSELVILATRLVRGLPQERATRREELLARLEKLTASQ